MELNSFFLVIVLLFLIYISSLVKEKSIMFFVVILFIFLVIKKYTEVQVQEKFQSPQEIEAINKLDEAVEKTADTDELKDRIGGLETNVEDLKKIIRAQNLSKQMERGEDAVTFSLTESQKRQDSNLESLEKEVDILLKLYKLESDNNDKDKYKTLPIYSSCKVKDQGKNNLRDSRTTEELVRDLERTETMKNLGLNSDSAQELYSLMEKENSQNVDVNFNLI